MPELKEESNTQNINNNDFLHHDVEENDFPSSDEPTYLPPSWEHYLDLLQDLCHHRNVIVTITAPDGAGKTMLMRHFIEVIHNDDPTHTLSHSVHSSSDLHICSSPNMQTCQIYAHSDLNKQELLTLLTEGFNLPPTLENTLDEQLQAQLHYLQDSTQRSILLIDNAENLPADILQTLLTLISQEPSSQTQFHVILFGSLRLQNTLNVLSQDPVFAEHILSLPLTPFSLEETKCYIEQQIENQIFDTTVEPTPSLIETIYKLSEGIPGKINKIAPRLLIAADASSTQKTAPTAYLQKRGINQTKIIGTFFILSLITASAYFLSKKPGTEAKGTLIAFTQEKNDINTNTTSTLKENLSPPPVTTQTDTPSLATENTATLETQQKLPPFQETSLVKEPLKSTPQTPPPSTNTLTHDKKTPPTTTNLSPSSHANVETINELPLTPETPIEITPPTKTSTPKPVHSTPSTQITQPNKTTPFNYTTDEKFLLSVGEKNYAIQIYTAETQRDINQFIQRYHLKNKTHIFRTTQSNQPWLTITYGTYSDYETAKAEIRTLPASLQKKCQVTRYKKIHEEIRRIKNLI